MKFGDLIIRNFLSFKYAELDLSKYNLNLILGINHDSKACSSNGSGKSGILEAIVWASYGQVFRAYEGDEVICNQVKRNCYVSLEFSDNGTSGKIERFRKYKGATGLKLTISGKDVSRSSVAETQKVIDSMLGVNFNAFANIISFPQGLIRYFASLSDRDQKAILEKVVGLEVFSRYLEIVKEEKGTLQLEIVSDEKEQDGKMQLNAAVIDRLRSLREKEQNFNAAKQADLQQLTEELKAVQAQKQNVKKRLEMSQSSIDIAQSKQETTQKQLDGCDEDKLLQQQKEAISEKQKFTEKVSFRRGEIIKLKGRVEITSKVTARLTKNKESAKLIGVEKCPYCGQKLTEQCLEKHKNNLTAQVDEIEESLGPVTDSVKLWATRMQEAEGGLQSFRSLRDQVDLFKSDVSMKKQSHSLIASEREVLAEKITANQSAIEQKRAEVSPYGQLIEADQQKKRQFEKLIAQLDEQLAKKREQMRYLSFWEVGFGNQGLKSYVLDNVVGVLNEKAHHYSEILTDGEASINFRTQTPLKGGEVREKFSVDVSLSNGTKSYKGASGGEKRRVDLAILLALRSLACSRSSKKFDLLIADEIFDNLDEPGVARAMDALIEEANNGSKVLLITRSPHLVNRDAFDRIITVEKRGGVSSIVDST